MSAWHALMLVVTIIASSPQGTLTPIECGMQYRGCACRFVEREGWQCRGFVPRTASEEAPKFPDEPRSAPRPPDPADIIPIQ